MRAIALACIAACGTTNESEVTSAVTTVINFDTLADGTWVTNQYAALGVVLPNGGYIEARATAHSPPQILRSTAPTTEFDTDPLRINFTSAQAHVKFYAGRGNDPVNGTLRLYDAAGALVATVGPYAIAGGMFSTVFDYTTATANVASMTLDYTGIYGAPKLIDDLELAGAAPPPPPPAPVVKINAPTSGQQLTSPNLVVTGGVAGDQLLSSSLVVKQNRPPGSTAPPTTTYTLPLSGLVSPRTFSRAVVLGVGYQWITASVTNTGGTGSATVLVTNLPQAIRDRFAADGGTATFGSLQWGGPVGGGTTACTYAVFSTGAIAQTNAKTFTVLAPVLAKWLAVKDTQAFPRLGCPTSGARSVAGGIAQDFQGGRIYSVGAANYWVSTTFASAIDALGGETMIGVPIQDPTSSVSVAQLQRFQIPGATTLPATFELYGSPQKLRVERQGIRDWRYDGIAIGASTPTIATTYDCNNGTSICTVYATLDSRFATAPDVCNDTTFGASDIVAELTPGATPDREWAPADAAHDDHAQTKYAGIVLSNARSHEDMPVTHDHMDGPCSWQITLADILAALIILDVPTALALAAEVALAVYVTGNYCPSDRDIHIRPLPGYEPMIVYGVDNLALEIEDYFYEQAPSYMFPAIGDLLVTSGRWIVDCGHNDPYKTEIHPPSIMMDVKTTTLNGIPTTLASLWVEKFYSGRTVELDIDPPPRPSPTAVLSFIAPNGSNTIDSLGVHIVKTTPDGNRVHLTITGSPAHEVEVTGAGEMKWDDLMQIPWFAGQWQVFWQ